MGFGRSVSDSADYSLFDRALVSFLLCATVVPADRTKMFGKYYTNSGINWTQVKTYLNYDFI